MCLSIPDIRVVVMVLPPSEPRITITGSNRLVRPAVDLRGPLGMAPFKELHITSTVMKGDGFSGCEWGSLCCVTMGPSLLTQVNDYSVMWFCSTKAWCDGGDA